MIPTREMTMLASFKALGSVEGSVMSTDTGGNKRSLGIDSCNASQTARGLREEICTLFNATEDVARALQM